MSRFMQTGRSRLAVMEENGEKSQPEPPEGNQDNGQDRESRR